MNEWMDGWMSSRRTHRRQKTSPLLCDLLLHSGQMLILPEPCMLSALRLICNVSLISFNPSVDFRGMDAVPLTLILSLENLNDLSKAEHLQGRGSSLNTATRLPLPLSLILFLFPITDF